jgi:hypothetical protein
MNQIEISSQKPARPRPTWDRAYLVCYKFAKRNRISRTELVISLYITALK